MKKSKFYQIKNITEREYTLVDCDGSVITRQIQDVDKSASAFTIKDAKDGDVLASELCDSIILFKGINDDNNIDFYCDYDFSEIDVPGDRFSVNNGQHYGNVEASEDFHPATKEQRDTLKKAMADAEYTFDFKKKELKKIEKKSTDNDMKELLHTEYEKGRADAIAEMQKPVDCTDCTNSKGCINCEDGNMKETLVQKTAWSEEDENILDAITYTVKNSGYKHCIGVSNEMMITFIKSLKGRVQPKQEWSKEDESIALGIEQIVNCASLLNVAPDRLNKVRDWLKSLRPQNRWKPTELQMDVLLDEVNAWTKGCPKQKVLESLYNDLKKLMEE